MFAGPCRENGTRLLLLLLSRFSRCLTLCNPIDGSPPGLREELKQTDFAVVHTTVTYKASSFPRTDSLSIFFRQQSLGPWLFSTQNNLHAKESDWGVKFCSPTLARVEGEPTESRPWCPLKICAKKGLKSRGKLVFPYCLAFCSLSCSDSTRLAGSTGPRAGGKKHTKLCL